MRHGDTLGTDDLAFTRTPSTNFLVEFTRLVDLDIGAGMFAGEQVISVSDQMP